MRLRGAALVEQAALSDGDNRAERYGGTRSYYQSSVPTQAKFVQGTAQTVHGTYQGVDSHTGLSQMGHSAGAVTGRAADRITQRRAAEGGPVDGLEPGEHLIPRRDADGVVRSYERPMKPEMLAAVDFDMNLSRMLGVWAGRLVEERESDG